MESKPELEQQQQQPRSSNGTSRARLPDFLQSVNLKYVKLGYHYLISHALALALLPLMLACLLEVGRMGPDRALELWTAALRTNLLTVLACCGILVFVVTLYAATRPRPIYLLDFACYLPADELKVSYSTFLRHSRLSGLFDERALDFQRRILERSGLGEETYLPPSLHKLPAEPNMAAARAEAADVMFGAVDALLASTGVRPKDIAVLVVNCSLFNPTPSLSAMIVNRYKLRGNIHSFNLGGMGCSAGVIAISLAADLLQAAPRGDRLALVVSTENITQNWYAGNDRSMLIPNCLFRMGGAAMLLSARRRDAGRAKYELLHAVRTHKGADDRCYGCVVQQQDGHGNMGVSLSKELMAIAGDALKTNITTLGPLVLPLSEQLLFLASLLTARLFRGGSGGSAAGRDKKKKPKQYIPDFKLAFEHFCIHAGGRAVIDELEKNLQLSPAHVEASRMTLHRFGNTSSSSTWYELAYLEAKRRIRRGDRVWQIAFGSGFKCNSAVWRALRSAPDKIGNTNPWRYCAHEYPVHIPDIVPLAPGAAAVAEAEAEAAAPAAPGANAAAAAAAAVN